MGGALGPSFGRKLLVLTQASRRVPSTGKCSVESSVRTIGWARTAARKRLASLVRQRPVTVLGEAGGIPDRVAHTEADEPTKLPAEVEPLDQWPL
jgi:hypothetical protein